MDLKKKLLDRPKVAINLLESISPSILMSLGKKTAVKVFNKALKNVAYQSHVSNFQLKDGKNQPATFSNAHYTDKKSFITSNTLEALLGTDLSECYTVERSSGYSGEPVFWPRKKGQDELGPSYFGIGFEKAYKISEKKTLLINTFALGLWVTGLKFARTACTLANLRDNKLTVINTGINLADNVQIFRTFAQKYEQVIIAGYPPFVKLLIDELFTQSVLPMKTPVHFVLGGEAFPEEYRDHIYSLFKQKVEDFKIKMFSAYGAADTGIEIGYEQELPILLRRLLIKDKKLRHKYLGDNIEYVPHFFQYNPLNIWIEELKSNDHNELLFTTESSLPIIKYNLHDSGGIFTFDKMLEILGNKYDVEKLKAKYKPLHLPVVYVNGRTDGTVTVFGINIYIEQLKSAFDNTELQKYLTGRFSVSSKYNEDIKQEFTLVCEMRDEKVTKTAQRIIEKSVISTLRRLNNEFNKAYESNRNTVYPMFQYVTEDEFNKSFGDTIKVRYK